jgi:hypothetical protein
MQGFSFVEFMVEGGWGMWPVLLFGATCLGGGLRFAVRPDRRWLAFTGAMWLTVVTTIAHAIVTDVGAVLRFLATSAQEHTTQILFQGLRESLRPAALGGFFLTLAALAVAVGAYRARWAEET